MNYKLGSLFDGSGGLPLAGSLCGIEPRWASEVEPYPITVTRERFPNMKHLGDISKINGAEIEPVDIITFGSPCQDLSVAGKRAGLKHEANGDEETTRSGLFMEAVRIIKEMRAATNGKYPRFALWENVPGAFSSNKGEDFRVVCEELIKVVEPSASMPEVPKNGWAYADSYIGDGWSLAYRTFDAQYWGVPQRRRRIHLVADFRGECARQVLFERKGVRGYFTQGRTPWQTTPADAQGCSGADDRTGEGNGAVGADLYNQTLTGDKAITLRCRGDNEHTPTVVYAVENHPADSRVNIDEIGKVPMVMEEKPPYCIGNGQVAQTRLSDKVGTLNCMHDQQAVMYWNGEQTTGTLTANNAGGNQRMPDKDNFNCIIEKSPRYIVRRLTPTECARLQGFADHWGHIEQKTELAAEEYQFWLEVRNTHAAINGKPVKEYTVKQMLTWYNKLHTDSAEYKMWGNGIALPPALYCMQGIIEVLTEARGEDHELSAEFVAEVAEPKRDIVCMATQQGGAEIRTDDNAETLEERSNEKMSNEPNNNPISTSESREQRKNDAYIEILQKRIDKLEKERDTYRLLYNTLLKSITEGVGA